MADYNLGTATGRVVIDSSGATAGMAAAGGAARGASRNLAATGASFTSAGKSVGIAGGLIVAAFGYAIKSASSFEHSLHGIAAVSGATKEQMELLRKKGLQLGADTAFSSNEAAQAMEALAKAGISIPDILNGAADATVALAAAGQIDLPQAAEIASNAMNQFALSSKELPKVADLISGAANNSAIDVHDFGETLSQVGAVAHLVGLSFADTSTAITIMGKAGIKGGKAGTALKAMFMQLQPRGDAATEAMMKLGAVTADGTNKFFDATGKMKSLAAVAQILKDGTKDMTEEQKTYNLQIAFGARGISAATAIMNEGASGVENLNKKLDGVKAADVAAERMKGLSGAMLQFKGSFDSLLIGIGSTFTPILEKIVRFAVKLTNAFGSLNPSVVKIVLIAVAAAGVFMTLLGIFLLVVGAIFKLAATFQALSALMMANPVVFLIGAFILLAVALVVAYKKIQPFHDAVNRLAGILADYLAPTISTIMGFVQNFVSQLQNLFSMFKSGEGDSQGFAEILDNMFGNTGKLVPLFRTLYDVVVQVFNWIKDSAVPAIQKMVDAVGGWGNVLKVVALVIAAVVAPFFTLVGVLIYAYNHFKTFHDVVDKVVSVVGTVIDKLGGIKKVLTVIGIAVAVALFPFLSLVAALVYAYTHFKTFHDIVNKVASVISGVLKAAFGWLKDNLPKIGNIIVAVAGFFAYLGKEIVERLKSAFGWLKDNVFPVFTALGELVAAVVGLVIRIWGGLWPIFKVFVGLLMTVLMPAFTFVFNLIKAIVTTFVNFVIGAWNAFGDKIWTAIKIAWGFVVGIVQAALEIVKGIIQVVTGIISGDWGKVWDGIKSIFGGVWDAIVAAVTAAIGVVSNTIATVLAAISLVWNTMWDGVKNFFSSIWDTIQSITSGGIGRVVSFVAGIPGKVLGALGSLAKTLYSAGGDLIRGLFHGIQKIWSVVVSWLGNLPGRVIGFIGDALGMLHDVGKKIITGLLNGIKEGFNDVKDFLGGAAGKIVSWKGPPSYDKTILIGNGKLIMQGLITGMDSMMPTLKANLGGITANIPGMVPSLPPQSAGGGVTIEMNFNGTFGAGGQDAIRQAVNEPSLLRQVIVAAQSGAGR